MSIIKIEFPADRPDIALALSTALQTIGTLTTLETLKKAEYSPARTDLTAAADEILGSAGLNDGTLLKGAGSDDNGQFSKSEIAEQSNLVDPAVVDTKGVPFNAEFCGKAEKPFYASGKNAGQWKKRQGVDEAAYNTWYMAELAKVVTAELDGPSQGSQAAVNTASAFGGQQQQQQEQTGPAVPHDAGTLMAWISEMQTAGRIDPQQVTSAYQQAGVTMTDVFPGPNKTVESIAQAAGNVHTILVSWMQ